jgi:uncharacterized protein YuzE
MAEAHGMKLHYYADTDSLYIEFTERPSSESREIADGIVVDLDDGGAIVGIDIDHASKHLDLASLETTGMSAARVRVA